MTSAPEGVLFPLGWVLGAPWPGSRLPACWLPRSFPYPGRLRASLTSPVLEPAGEQLGAELWSGRDSCSRRWEALPSLPPGLFHLSASPFFGSTSSVTWGRALRPGAAVPGPQVPRPPVTQRVRGGAAPGHRREGHASGKAGRWPPSSRLFRPLQREPRHSLRPPGCSGCGEASPPFWVIRVQCRLQLARDPRQALPKCPGEEASQ